jgi:hypothetical protein
LRSNVNRPALVRQLAGFLPDGGTALGDTPRQDLAERLGQWLNVADAIALSSALPSVAAVGSRAAAQPARPPVNAVGLRAELDRVRAVLTQSITARDSRHPPDPTAPDSEFALALQRHHEQQRCMELAVEALRGHVRQTLARATPRLAQLAALDAVLDQMLAGREQRLLNHLPAFLKTRFNQLRPPSDSDAPSDPDWLPGFNAELDQTLLAELDHRLQPVVGMIEAIEAADA